MPAPAPAPAASTSALVRHHRARVLYERLRQQEAATFERYYDLLRHDHPAYHSFTADPPSLIAAMQDRAGHADPDSAAADSDNDCLPPPRGTCGACAMFKWVEGPHGWYVCGECGEEREDVPAHDGGT